MQLLAHCARMRMGPGIQKQIRDLAATPLDWDLFLTAASEHSVIPLVERQLRAVAPDVIPPVAMDRLKSAARASTVRCLVLSAELVKVLGAFRSDGIWAVPYKGPVLAVQAYGDVALREFGDLDIILPQAEMPRAHAIVLGLGYRAKFPPVFDPRATVPLVPGEYNYIDEARRLLVELHTELTLRHFPVKPDLSGLAKRLVPIELAGQQIQTFSVEDSLPILCIHGSKDFWERLLWIADISELIQCYPGLNWDRVLQNTEALRAERMLYLGLALAEALWELPLPREVLDRVHQDSVAATLALEIQRRLLGRESSSLGAGGRFRFRRLMLPNIFAGWGYSMRLAFAPAEEDWQGVRLPRSLASLYFVLRPLRLLRKYGWTGRRA
jgi:hypothetical protein